MRSLVIAGVNLSMSPRVFANTPMPKHPQELLQTVYRAVNGPLEKNLEKIIQMMGGMQKLIEGEDVVVIKPNAQWWNQGAPNLAALKTFVDLIMERPGGFKGEVVLAENCHRGSQPWNHAGWHTPFSRNTDSDLLKNISDLSNHLKKKYGNKISVCHWIDVAAGGKRVFSPKDGDGYVYCDGTGGVPLISCDNGLKGLDDRATVMTYPIFTTDRETTIDFKNGIWKQGAYTDQPLKFVNFAALNHHSTYCGMTSAVKNYMGITDLSGGPDPNKNGRLTKDYYNFHSFPFNEWSHGPEPGMLGKEIGTFMRTIRKADLNITTAEWIGLSSRVDCPVVQTRAILASTDPVALDYHAAKYLLYPNSQISLHNPDNKKGPLRQYLLKCAEAECGTLDERFVKVTSYDFKTKTLQKENELAVKGKKEWGNNVKAIMKYLYLRLAG